MHCSIHYKLIAAVGALLLSCAQAKAEIAVFFVQPPNSVPIPGLADAAGRLVVTGSAATATTDKSTFVITGGTFQSITGVNGQRKGLEFTNTCNVAGNCVSTGDMCYLYFGSSTADKTVAIQVPPTATYLRSNGAIPQEAVFATCDGTNDTFRFVEQ